MEKRSVEPPNLVLDKRPFHRHINIVNVEIVRAHPSSGGVQKFHDGRKGEGGALGPASHGRHKVRRGLDGRHGSVTDGRRRV